MIPYSGKANPAFITALADRYAVKHEVGRGATATVYLAQDLRHKRRVAIKLLHPSIATVISEQRFLREIGVAARLIHPNILPVLDSGEAAGLLYYVMPFVEDRTLRDVLRERGALSVADSIRIAAEIAEALDYAHRQGVVHRDIKPGNILLVADHAVINDFGIALIAAESESEPLTQPGEDAVGTPAYMSPEQATGAAVDGRSDIYSLGVVLHEMLTGVRPGNVVAGHSLRSSMTDLRRRVTNDSVPRWMADVTHRALALDPNHRFRRAADMSRALKSDHRRLSPVAIATAVLLTVAAAVIALVSGNARARRESTQVNGQQRVAVAEFVNRTTDSTLGYLGIMAADWITEGLQQTGLLDVVPTPTALQASRFAASRVLGQQDPVRTIATETNATIVVTGSYYRIGAQLQLQVQVADVANSRLLGAVSPVAASLASPSAAIDSLRTRVMGLLATRLDVRISSSVALSEHPPTFEAYREFAQGLDDYIGNDFAGAARQFIAATRRDSTFSTALLMASISLSNQGHYAEADSVLSRLLPRRNELGPYHQHWFDYRRSVLRGDRRSALSAIRELAAAAPGTKATYNWAVEAMQNNYVEEARNALRSLEPGVGPMRGWAPYWDVLGRLEHTLRNHQGELDAGTRARAMFPDRVYALGTSVRALAAMGRRAQVDALLNVARGMPPDPLGTSVGELALEAAIELLAHGHLEASRPVLAQGLLWYEEREARGPLSPSERQFRARSYYEMGDLPAAANVVSTLLVEQPLSPEYLGLSALIAERSGDSNTAARSLETLLQLPRAYALGVPSFEAARVLAASGQTRRALQLLTESLAEGKEFDLWAHRDQALLTLQSDPRYRELVRLKR